MEKKAGYVDHIIYRNTGNGYTVFELVSEGEEITCVGTFRALDEGENLELTGGYVAHAVYGNQFKVRPGSSGNSERIPSGLWKKNRNALPRSRG